MSYLTWDERNSPAEPQTCEQQEISLDFRVVSYSIIPNQDGRHLILLNTRSVQHWELPWSSQIPEPWTSTLHHHFGMDSWKVDHWLWWVKAICVSEGFVFFFFFTMTTITSYKSQRLPRSQVTVQSSAAYHMVFVSHHLINLCNETSLLLTVTKLFKDSIREISWEKEITP